MKKITLTLFLLILFSVFAFSQKKDAEARRVDFNGTWVLDKSSNGTGIDKKTFDSYLLYIAFKDNKFEITKVFVSGKKAANYGITLSTDKSGETNNYTGFDGNIKRISKTRWEKDTLVSEYKLTPDSKRYTVGGTEKYSLSKDGQKLILESVQTYPVVPLFVEDLTRARLVFRRKESKN